MKIMILNPPMEWTVLENADDEGEAFIDTHEFGHFPPLGALYVLSYLEKHTSGHQFSFVDCVAEHISHQDLDGVIRQHMPDIVGITSFTTSLVDVQMAGQAVRRVVPEAHICMGGHHPISFPFEAAQLPEFDSIVVGEGEYAFTDLVKALDTGGDITAILGVYTKESIEKHVGVHYERDRRFLPGVNVPAAYVDDIDDVPFPNREFIRHTSYHSTVGVSDHLATIITTRGCPYLCTFCNVPYKKYRQRDFDRILDEVQECLDMGYDEFHFYDDLFNITAKKVTEFCEAILRRNMKFVWDFRGRVNAVTYDSLVIAKKAGLRQISFGVETGSDEGLKLLRKGTKIKQVRNAFEWCRKLGIRAVADYMMGLPFEKTKQDVYNNLDFLISLDPDFAQFSILSLYPNTQVFDEAVEKGMIDADRWRNFSLNPYKNMTVDHWTEFMNVEELSDLHKECYRRFYLRPKFVIRSVLETRSFQEFKVKAFGLRKLVA
jgi:anaerobic magnesium-protoporphyrin IX monomethyl ester cyclase